MFPALNSPELRQIESLKISKNFQKGSSTERKNKQICLENSVWLSTSDYTFEYRIL